MFASNKIFNMDDSNSSSGDFLLKNGVEYSGTHLLIDLWGAKRLDDQDFMQQTLKDCVVACHATLLHIHCHQFSNTGGLSGVAVLAESHISVHTWPERDYAAFDVFMCGGAKPLNVVDVLTAAFKPEAIDVQEILRGNKDAPKASLLKPHSGA